MVQLLGSCSDSVLPGVRYLCVVPSLLFARPCCRWAFLYDVFYFRFSVLDHCLLSLLCLSLNSLIAILVFTLCCLSRESSGCLVWLMCSALLHEVFLFAGHTAIVYCLLRKSFGCLNWLVNSALPGEVSIADRRAIVYCLLRKSLGCLNRLAYMALLGEVSIG